MIGSENNIFLEHILDELLHGFHFKDALIEAGERDTIGLVRSCLCVTFDGILEKENEKNFLEFD